jgi:hypothetical protein
MHAHAKDVKQLRAPLTHMRGTLRLIAKRIDDKRRRHAAHEMEQRLREALTSN